MIGLLLIANMLAAERPAPTPAAPTSDEIMVTARKGKCELQMARHVLTSREIEDLAKTWGPGRSVRIIEPKGASQKCDIKIMSELAQRGVHDAVFVDREDDQ